MRKKRFTLKLDDGKDGIPIAICEKRERSRTPHYLVTTDANQMDRSSDSYVGKIRSNFIGSSFTAYGPGANPKHPYRYGVEQIREELCLVTFPKHALKVESWTLKRTERVVNITIPHVHEINGEAVRIPVESKVNSNLASLINHHSQCTATNGRPRVTTYTTRVSTWDGRRNCYVLPFSKRVGKRSIRNVQIVRTDIADDLVLQFGRKDDRFNLDFGYPFSPMVALTLAVSLMDYKICIQ